MTFDLDIVSAGDGGRYSTGSFPYRWNPRLPARVGTFAREGDGTDIRWYDVEPCYVFHPLNAYDDGEDLVLDLVRHRRCSPPI